MTYPRTFNFVPRTYIVPRTSNILHCMLLSSLYIGSTPQMGRGVFTTHDIEAGMLVEVAPVIVMGKNERKLLDQTLLHDYIFEWGQSKDQCAMALGYVPIYNHSYRSNCEYEMDFEREEIRVKAVHFIKAGAELFINYNGDWDDNKPVWFQTQ